MDICHICFDKKDTQEKEIYCSHCSPFICSECLVLWKKENQTCPICKRSDICIVDIDEDILETTPVESPSIPEIQTHQDERDLDCSGRCIVKKTIIWYIILSFIGFVHFASFALYEGEDVRKRVLFYMKEPIMYFIFPLIGGYVILLLFVVILPIIYLCQAIVN